MKKTTSIALALLALAAPLTASEFQIELEPDNTTISFTLGATMHTVHGVATPASGTLRLDDSTGQMTGEVSVDSTTAETGNKKRDKKMHAKVLRSADHSRIVLSPHRLDGALATAGASDVTLHGEMEILGQSHDIAIPLHIEIANGRFTADGSFDVPFVEWGLEDPSTFVLRVAKVVEITIEATGTIVTTAETSP